jgi:hypothetical protein
LSSIAPLFRKHRGETATIVGMGPSVLRLRPQDFPAGPVITLNHAVIPVRRLELRNPMYVMQKDGCQPHTGQSAVPLSCVCPSDRLVPPIRGETAIFSTAESPDCFPNHKPRYVIDVEGDFGLPWASMSAPVAALLADWMGCATILMMGMDSYTRKDYRRASPNGGSNRGYRVASVQAKDLAEKHGLTISWYDPPRRQRQPSW